MFIFWLATQTMYSQIQKNQRFKNINNIWIRTWIRRFLFPSIDTYKTCLGYVLFKDTKMQVNYNSLTYPVTISQENFIGILGWPIANDPTRVFHDLSTTQEWQYCQLCFLAMSFKIKKTSKVCNLEM